LSVQGINGAVPQLVGGGSGRLYLPGALDFSQTLNIGQIIEGKVLRQFDDTRYSVTFGDHERVVDSSIPLSAGDVLYGRVIGLGERVELQRIYRDPQTVQKSAQQPVADPANTRALSGRAANIEELLQRYQVSLTEAERASVERAARSVEDPQALGWASALLNKLGLSVAPPLLNALYAAQFTRPASAAPPGSVADGKVPQVLAVWEAPPQAATAAVRDLADGVRKIMTAKARQHSATRGALTPQEPASAMGPAAVLADPLGARSGQSGQPDSQRQGMEQLASWILNAQTGGVVSHALGVLPLLAGGKLIEVNVALFEQQREGQAEQRLAHRQVVLSLRTEHLGQVQVIARMAGEHVRITVATDDSDHTRKAAQYSAVFKEALKGGAWQVDEISYVTRLTGSHNGVVRSVIEHVVSQDTLNSFV
jgi:hypothetical protein